MHHHIKEEVISEEEMLITTIDLNIDLVYRIKVTKEIKVKPMIQKGNHPGRKELERSHSERCWMRIKRASQLFKTGVRTRRRPKIRFKRKGACS